MKDLNKIVLLDGCGSDKGNADHKFGGRSYLDVYNDLFRAWAEDAFTMLEIGVLYGHSLNMWSRFFNRAEIVGLDIYPQCGHLSDRITVTTGDQNDSPTLRTIVDKHGPFRIVIDDGSHAVPHILKGFSELFSAVESGGWYIIEDMRISYVGLDGGWPGMHKNSNESISGHERAGMDNLILKMIRDLDYCIGDIRQIQSHPMMLCIQHL